MKEVKRTMELETFYDLVANLGADIGSDRIDLHRVGPDGTRLEDPWARMDVLVYWTDEFNRLHAKTDGAEVDYIETVDDFYAAKIKPFVKEKQIVGYGFDTDRKALQALANGHGEEDLDWDTIASVFLADLLTSATATIVQRARNHNVEEIPDMKGTQPYRWGEGAVEMAVCKLCEKRCWSQAVACLPNCAGFLSAAECWTMSASATGRRSAMARWNRTSAMIAP